MESYSKYPQIPWKLIPKMGMHLKSCESKSKWHFSSWAKHEFKMSHEPNEMQHTPIKGEKYVQVSKKDAQATF